MHCREAARATRETNVLKGMGESMAYSKADFRILKEKFQKTLIDQNNEPLSCALYDAPSFTDR